MADFLRSECPHCTQQIEFPARGAGQDVQCPTCEETVVLTPVKEAQTVGSSPGRTLTTPAIPSSVAKGRATLPPIRSGPPVAEPVAISVTVALKPKPPSPGPLDHAFEQIERDPAFSVCRPTREQVARAWAMANFNREDESAPPTHLELVAALRKLFKEFKEAKPKLTENAATALHR